MDKIFGEKRNKTARLTLCAVLIVLISACAKEAIPTWQEQYDLGVRYLSEGNYEEAIIAFTAAIEIEEKAEAYVGRGQAYLLSGDSVENISAALADFEIATELDSGDINAWQAILDIRIANGEYDEARELIERAREAMGNNDAFEDEYGQIDEEIAKKAAKEAAEQAVDVVLANEAMWADLLTDMLDPGTGLANHAFFADLDFDGIPEFIVESPTVGSGEITEREIFKVDTGGITKMLKEESHTGDWDEISLWRDKKSGEYFYVGYDRVQNGWEDSTSRWARLCLENGKLKATQLYMKESPYSGNFIYHGGDENTAISGEEFYALMEQTRDEAEELGTWHGTTITDWNTEKTTEKKRETLLAAYIAEPLWETENDGSVVWVDLERSYGSYESAVLRGLDASGYPVWSYVSESYIATELYRVAGIGIRENGYYFVESGVVKAFDLQTGQLIWENPDFGGADPVSAFTEDGRLLISGYYGPDFFAVSLEGETLKRIETFDSNYYWPMSMSVDGNRAIVHFDMGPDWYYYTGGHNFYVDLDDWSYGYLGPG